jgi:hypothetical protein
MKAQGKHQSTMDGTGIWQPGIEMARQMQMEGEGAMYLFTSVGNALLHGQEMLLAYPWLRMKPHVIIAVGSDPTYVYGLDSRLPPYKVEVLT